VTGSACRENLVARPFDEQDALGKHSLPVEQAGARYEFFELRRLEKAIGGIDLAAIRVAAKFFCLLQCYGLMPFLLKALNA